MDRAHETVDRGSAARPIRGSRVPGHRAPRLVLHTHALQPPGDHGRGRGRPSVLHAAPARRWLGRRPLSERPLVLLRVSTRPLETLRPLWGNNPPLMKELFELEERHAAGALELEQSLHEAAGDRSDAQDSRHARGRLALIGLRRDVHNLRSLTEDHLRDAAPLMTSRVAASLEAYARAHHSLLKLEHACRNACADELIRMQSALLEGMADPLVEEGVWLASRSLLAGIRRLRNRDVAGWGHRERHVAGKALAYLTRFCTKTSPNGLFCATGIADVDEGPLTIEGKPEIAHVDALLSVAEARKVAACLANDPAIDRAIRPRPNPTLRDQDGMWTFWKPASMRNPDDDEVRSRTEVQEIVAIFLEESGRDLWNVPELLDAVSKRSGVNTVDLDSFYRQLVQGGLLIGEIEAAYNARRPLRDLADACRHAGCEPSWLTAIETVEQTVDELPRLTGPERMAAMERVGRILEDLPHTRPLLHDELYRLDGASAIRLHLPESMLEEVRAGLAPYTRLFSALYPERIYRTALAARFRQFFPPDTDVNLLDVYHGAFEPDAKHRPIAFPDPARVALSGETREASTALARAREHFAQRAREARPGEELQISESEIREIVGNFPEPRWSCGALFQVAAADVASIHRGEYRLVLSALLHGAGLALARFAHLLGGEPTAENPVVRELRRGWSCLERPGTIVAELTYNHNYRTANAGLRPSIFRHEIELPGEKASPGAEVIPLRELTVRWDTTQSRFVLRWTRDGTEVLPVITSGVNPVGAIQFLVNIGQQGLQPLGYFPGFDVEGVTRWPRFVCGKLVVFRERWAFGPGMWPVPQRPGRDFDAAGWFLDVQRWRRRHGLPRHVFIHTTENPKPRYVDLESPLFSDLILRTLTVTTSDSPREVHVTEMLPGPGELWAADDRGHYATELLVHLEHQP